MPVIALLLTTPGCAHCAALKKILDKLVNEDKIDQLDVVDVTKQPDIAGQYGVKSVPWLQLGDFQFQGSMTEKELRQWVDDLSAPDDNSHYIKHLLTNGELNTVIQMVRDGKQDIMDLLPLVQEADLDYKVRLGISAVFEELEGDDRLKNIVDDLGELAGHESPRVRSDTAHFLVLTHSDNAIPYLQQLAKDENNEVREIAGDALNYQ